MADNGGSGSVHPRIKTANEKVKVATTIAAATASNDTTRETEPESLNVVAPKGKRRRTSSLNKNRNTLGGQTDALSRNGEASTTAGTVQQSMYQGNVSELLRQQQEAAQNNSQFLQAQLEGIYGRAPAQSYMPPNATTLMIANQLRQAGGTAPFLHGPQIQSNNDLQQLSVLLQQHLYGVGLAHTLGINRTSNQEAVGGSFASTTPSFAQSTSQLMRGSSTNSDSFSSTLQATSTGNTTRDSTAAISSSATNRNNESVTRVNRSLDTVQQNDTNGGITGRPPIPLYITCDNDSLSEYQCLVRKHIELFEAGVEDVESNAQGRNRPIVLGQVGIRCRHCTMLPPRHRSRGAIYYPSKLQGIYQAAQNLAVAHLGEHCQNVPDDVRAALSKLRERKSSAGCGKRYWANGVRVLGVFEDRDGLRFESTFVKNDGSN